MFSTVKLKLRRDAGFTLIELVSVLVLLGILAAIALPRFTNLSISANQSAINNVAGALSIASSDNYDKRSANSALGSTVANCTDVGPLVAGGLPTGYTITAAAIAANVTVNCTLTGPSGLTATFQGIGIP